MGDNLKNHMYVFVLLCLCLISSAFGTIPDMGFASVHPFSSSESSKVKSLSKVKKIKTKKKFNSAYLKKRFEQNYSKKSDLKKLRNEAVSYGRKAVPVLTEVMKSGKYPDKNRWLATFTLGRIMGKKASPFISKFMNHPGWVMRMAALKTLLVLKEKRYADMFVEALKDDSLIVRTQALENIRILNLNDKAPYVWSMLYDKRNYYEIKKKGHKRTNLVKKIVRVIGDLKFEKAKGPLLKMAAKKKYVDIFSEIDYSLGKITGKSSPGGDITVKRIYWNKIAVTDKVIL